MDLSLHINTHIMVPFFNNATNDTVLSSRFLLLLKYLSDSYSYFIFVPFHHCWIVKIDLHKVSFLLMITIKRPEIKEKDISNYFYHSEMK